MGNVTVTESDTRAPAHSFGSLAAAAARALSKASPTPRLDAELLLAFAAGVSRGKVIAFSEQSLSIEGEARFGDVLARRIRGEPLAYIRGDKEFYSISVRVTPDVLIPRPETELIVEEALARTAVASNCAVLDLGTGSGAIALAIGHARHNASVTAADASSAAVQVARENAALLGLKLRCLESNWFDRLNSERFDLIVCNPPYVPSDDPHFDDALRFEPRTALDGGADGLDSIRAVLTGAGAHLAAGGLLILEHGYDQRESVITLAGERGLATVATRRDLGGRPRLLVLQARPA